MSDVGGGVLFDTRDYVLTLSIAIAFLLEDRNHNAAHAFAFAEYLLEETFLSEKWLSYKRSPYLIGIGTHRVALVA